MHATCLAQIAYVSGQLWVAIDEATLEQSVLEKTQQPLIVLAARTHQLRLPDVVAVGVHSHGLAQPANAVPAFMALDESALQLTHHLHTRMNRWPKSSMLDRVFT